MLPNPITPPNEYTGNTALGLDLDVVNGLVTNFINYGSQQFASPVSNGQMGVEEKSELEDRAEFQEMSDDNHELSDGGAPLNMNAEQMDVDTNLDMNLGTINSQSLGDSFYDIPSPNPIIPITYEEIEYSETHPPYLQNTQPQTNQNLHSLYMYEMGNEASLPNTMSAVSLQLQHLQDQDFQVEYSQNTQDNAESVTDGDDFHPVANMTDIRNHNLIEFLLNWNHQFGRPSDQRRRPRADHISSLVRHGKPKLPPVFRSDLQGEKCDIQGIDWTDLGVTRLEARQMRRHTYKNYNSVPQHTWHPRVKSNRLSDDQNFFRFRKMDFDHNIHLSHFQLRNLLACATRDHIFYAAPAKILHCSPQSNKYHNRITAALDMTHSVVQPFHTFGASTNFTALSEGHDILVAGGYDGEYGLMNLKASKQTKHTEGIITDHQNSITNHVQVHLSRNSTSPLVTFASNDSGVRTLDVATNKFISKAYYDHAINCTAISPDQRLRVLVGDTRQVMICNATTGDVLQTLEGHRDYGFACDWADDGWTVATGNQDMQVKIWDARKWTNSSGAANPVTSIAADMGGVRKVKFSPLGSGKRILVASEPADIVNIIDGENFQSKQTLSFFGEIGGFDFTNDGQDLIVANCDPNRGGLMEFERCDLASSGGHGLAEYKESRFRSRVRRDYRDYDEDDLMSHPRSRGTDEQRRRKPASLGINMGYF